jgi:hypothetical protein
VLEHNFVLNTQISPFIIGLANELHELNKKIILVIPVSFPTTCLPCILVRSLITHTHDHNSRKRATRMRTA